MNAPPIYVRMHCVRMNANAFGRNKENQVGINRIIDESANVIVEISVIARKLLNLVYNTIIKTIHTKNTAEPVKVKQIINKIIYMVLE